MRTLEAKGVEVAVHVSYIEHPMRNSCSTIEVRTSLGVFIREERLSRGRVDHGKNRAFLNDYQPRNCCDGCKHRPIQQAIFP